MRRAALAALALVLACGGRVATAEVTFKLPPPDIVGLLPFAAVPLDKPPVPVPSVAIPPAPALPDPPAPRLVSDISHRPVAPMPPPRILACNPMGTVFRVASELLECGRARYQRGELEGARSAFQNAVDEAGEQSVTREARYWLGETLLRLGRPAEAQTPLAVVALDDPRGEFAYFANHELGYIALEQNDPARALGYFEGLLKGRMPIVLIPSSRHGRALALYGLKRYGEARDEWSALMGGGPNVPRPLVTEATFWMGETLGRLGDYKGAVSRLQTFTATGSRLLMESGLLSLGWWNRADGRAEEAIKAYRTLLSTYPDAGAAGLWARAGLVQALLDTDDYPKAREEFKQLEALDKQGAVTGPTLLLLRRWAADKSKVDEARELDTDLLGRQLAPAARAWVLLLSADLARQTGNPEEARDRLELIAVAPASSAVKQQADLRRAQLGFDAREFAQAQSIAKGLLDQPLSQDLRAAAMVVAAESAYWARDYDTAATLYGRFMSEFSGRPEVPSAGVALGWAEFRRGRLEAARQRWTAFAREAPGDPRAADTLLLAAELADKAGDTAEARSLLDRVVSQHSRTEQADVARLNRAILALRAGRPQEALTELGRLAARSSSPDLARARVARGIALMQTKGDAQAEADFKGGLGYGDDALCHLGLGVIAFRRGQWDAAAREFAEARDIGGAGTGAAEYGLAAVAFNQGKTDDFKKAAAALLGGPPSTATPQLIHGMEALAIEDKRWGEARTLAMRLADQFPRHADTPSALAELGAAAASDAQWPLARDMYQVLASRYPSSPGRMAGRAAFGEALLRTGAAPEARRELEGLVASLPAGDPTRARVLQILAEAQEATGDRAAAAQSYTRAAVESPRGKGASTAELGAGRLLQGEGKWSEARPLLERALTAGEPSVAAEAAYHMGEGLRSAGQHDDAIEAYMTAAYVAPDTSWGRRALLGAGRSFAALKQNDAAAIVYRKLLAASSVEPDLQNAARQGLSALGLN